MNRKVAVQAFPEAPKVIAFYADPCGYEQLWNSIEDASRLEKTRVALEHSQQGLFQELEVKVVENVLPDSFFLKGEFPDVAYQPIPVPPNLTLGLGICDIGDTGCLQRTWALVNDEMTFVMRCGRCGRRTRTNEVLQFQYDEKFSQLERKPYELRLHQTEDAGTQDDQVDEQADYEAPSDADRPAMPEQDHFLRSFYNRSAPAILHVEGTVPSLKYFCATMKYFVKILDEDCPEEWCHLHTIRQTDINQFSMLYIYDDFRTFGERNRLSAMLRPWWLYLRYVYCSTHLSCGWKGWMLDAVATKEMRFLESYDMSAGCPQCGLPLSDLDVACYHVNC